MNFSRELTDEAVLRELGRRLSRRRLALHMTQAALADDAGVSKRTVERLEAGASGQLVNLIRILRSLDLVGGLEAVAPAPAPSPVDLLKLRKERQRAPSKPPSQAGGAWTWGDDT